MSTVTIMGVAGSLLVGLGLFGLIVQSEVMRRVVSVNLLGSGVFLLLGVFARRGEGGGWSSDPVPQAMVITGIVVAFAGTALAVALARRFEELGGGTELPDHDEDPGATLAPSVRGLEPCPPAGAVEARRS